TSLVDVQHRGFLNIASGFDDDRSVITPDRDMRPNAHAGLQGDVADHIGTVGDVHTGINGRDLVVELINRHTAIFSGRFRHRSWPRVFPRASATPGVGSCRLSSWGVRQ